MTRINCGIEPIRLTDQHLIAELRELPRIFTAVIKKVKENKPITNIPPKFKLGTGHVTFFYNKCDYLIKRHKILRDEYENRFNKGYTFYEHELHNIPNDCMNNYNPTMEDKNILIERISERIINSKQTPRYYSEKINKKDAVDLLYY